MSFHIKICGLKNPDLVDVAINAGADMVGLVFFSKSPRHLSPEEAANVALAARSRAATVGLFVNPKDRMLASVVGKIPLTHVQLHGTETPERAKSIKQRYGLPIIKAIGVETAVDVNLGIKYGSAAEMLLFDTKATVAAKLPGGRGEPFDWTMLSAVAGDLPWLLAGGLTPDTVADAIAAVRHLPGFAGVDVSSGVERVRGMKDPALIGEFVANAQTALSDLQTKEA